MNAPGIGEFNGVAEQIEQHLHQAFFVENDVFEQRAVHFRNESEMFLIGTHPADVRDRAQKRTKIEFSRHEVHFARFDFGQIEDVIDQHQQMFARFFDHCHANFVGSRHGFRTLQNLRIPQDGIQRRAQFVTHARQSSLLA